MANPLDIANPRPWLVVACLACKAEGRPWLMTTGKHCPHKWEPIYNPKPKAQR